MLREQHLSLNDLIYPLFLVEGKQIKREISSLPGVFQLSIDEMLKECEALLAMNIKSILLFAVIDAKLKDAKGLIACCEDALVARALREIKKRFGSDIYVITDLCFCEYTDHGHCGELNERGEVDNDATLKLLATQALLHAQSGADMIAPSGMMDLTISTLRTKLDEAGFCELPLMAYSTKFASSYYGPFRDIANCAPSFGDRASYQMDVANGKEALHESLIDEAQGADILMVKPALAFLDVVSNIRANTLLPLCVYNVSGEYALLKAGAAAGVIDYERVLMENMLSFKRAGADLIITYHAKELAELLSRQL